MMYIYLQNMEMTSVYTGQVKDHTAQSWNSEGVLVEAYLELIAVHTTFEWRLTLQTMQTLPFGRALVFSRLSSKQIGAV